MWLCNLIHLFLTIIFNRFLGIFNFLGTLNFVIVEFHLTYYFMNERIWWQLRGNLKKKNSSTNFVLSLIKEVLK